MARRVGEILSDRNAHIHLVGIEGTGLSAIARVLLEMGYEVSGSDRAVGDRSKVLSSLGAVVFDGHESGNVDGADLVLVSSAVPEDNPEVVEARRRGTPVVKRADFLGDLTSGRDVIAVAGTHGKTTTTAMISFILTGVGLDPGFIVGGTMLDLGENAHAGTGRSFVIEADEYDGMFLGLEPKVAVVTNVEWDHVDCYPTPENHRKAFVEFLRRVKPGGTGIVFSGDEGARSVENTVAREDVRWVEYGVQSGQWRAEQVISGREGASFLLVHPEGKCWVRLALSGVHNVANAIAAAAASFYAEGVPPEVSGELLADFHGAERRFQVKGEAQGVVVVDDYAHHPTEIKATIRMARDKYPDREIWVVFQPHTFTRTKAMLDGFASSFSDADHVFVTDIYPAREKDDLGVHSRQIVSRSEHPDISYTGGIETTFRIVTEKIRPGSVLLTLGAGDGYRIGEMVLESLKEQGRGGA